MKPVTDDLRRKLDAFALEHVSSRSLGVVRIMTSLDMVWLGFMLHIGILFIFAVTYFSMMMMTVLFACLPPQRVHEIISLMFREHSSSPAPDGDRKSGRRSGREGRKPGFVPELVASLRW